MNRRPLGGYIMVRWTAFTRAVSVVVAVFAAVTSVAATPPAGRLDAVKRSVPGVTWEAPAAAADFDCDGKTDWAFLGRRGRSVIVAFALTSKTQVEWFEFGVGDDAQDSICEEPAQLAIEKLEWDPSADVDGVEGFRTSKSCRGLQLIGGECDFFHFYWNHKRKRVSWWRL